MMKNKLIAIILTLITVFSVVAVPAGAAAQTSKKSGVADIVDIWNNGYPMPDLGDIVESLFTVNKLLYQTTGLPLFTDENLVIRLDDTLSGIVDSVLETANVDFYKIFNNLPQSNHAAELVTSTMHIDIPATQDFLNSVSNDCFAQNNAVLGIVIRLVSVWLGIVDDAILVAKPVEGKPGLYEICIEITYRDGRKDGSGSGIYYDSNENAFVGKDGSPAFLGYYMDFDQNMIYTGTDVWQRELGFNIFYDIFCFLTPYFFHYTTTRIKFDYDGREWMIQAWKGRYVIANGGEIGVYTREAERNGSFYDCAGDEDMLVMSIELYHGDKLLFKRDPMLHWWMTGFVLSDTAYLPESLTLVSTLTMKDEEMLKAFTDAIDKKLGLISYEVDGLNVTLTW